MAPLIMVTLPTVASFFSTCGCFLRDEDPLPEISLLSLSILWIASRCEWLSFANGSASRDLGLKIFRVQGKGVEPTPELGQAGRLGPTVLGPSHPSSVAPSLPWVLIHLCTLPPLLAPFDDVVLASKMEALFA
jgi:hypothetical protein